MLVAGSSQVLGQQAEVGLELQLMEVELGGLEEAILEVVQVEEHGVLVEGGLRIAVREVELAGSTQLDIGQLADRAFQEFLLGQRISASGFASTANGVEERNGSKVLLQIAQLVVAHGKHMGNGQLPTLEVAGQVDEGMVLVATGTDAADDTLSLSIPKAVVLAIAACSRQLLHGGGLCPTPLLV